MQRKGPLPGKIFAWCILQRRFAGHFEYMESISCQNQLILDTWRRYFARNVAFLLPGVRFEDALFKGCAFICPKWASKKFRPGMHPFAIRKCASKMLRPGPFGCAGEREMIIAVFSLRQSVSSVPWGFGRCGAAELRAPDVAVDANGGGAGGA